MSADNPQNSNSAPASVAPATADQESTRATDSSYAQGIPVGTVGEAGCGSADSPSHKSAHEVELEALKLRYASQLGRYAEVPNLGKSRRPAPVITPIKGSAPSSLKTKMPGQPMWRKWRAIQRVRVWEGVALTLGIDPDTADQTDDDWPDEPGNWLVERPEYQERLAIAEGKLRDDDGTFEITERDSTSLRYYSIPLRQFVT